MEYADDIVLLSHTHRKIRAPPVLQYASLPFIFILLTNFIVLFCVSLFSLASIHYSFARILLSNYL